jgi:hypothetical protein
MIICKDCGWKATTINECDAESEFSNHVLEHHMEKGEINSKLLEEMHNNIKITQFNPEKNNYAIYVKDSCIGYYSKMLFPNDVGLQERSKNKLTSLKETIELSKEISKYTGLSIHQTKGVYGNHCYVAHII